MAQLAGRASVQLHTLLYFKDRKVVEEACIIDVKSDALVVLVPRYGIEGVVRLIPAESAVSTEKEANTTGSSTAGMTEAEKEAACPYKLEKDNA